MENSGADSTSRRVRALKYGLLFMLLAGLVFSFVFFRYSRPIYHQWLSFRADWQAGKAEVAMDEEEWNRAAGFLSKAYRGASESPRVLSAMARFHGPIDVKQQRFFLGRLYELDGADDADLRALVRLDEVAGGTARARLILTDLMKRQPNDRENLELASWMEFRRGELPEAEVYMERALDADPADDDVRLKLAVLRTKSMFLEKVGEAWQDIWSLAQSDGETGIKALRYLRDKRDLDAEDAEALYDLFRMHPDASEVDVVLALQKHYTNAGSQAARDLIVQQAMIEREGRGPSEMVIFLRWLEGEGRAREILEIFSGDPGLDSSERTAIYLNASNMMGRRDLIQGVFDRSEEAELLSQQLFVKALCIAYLRDDDSMVFRFLKDSFLHALDNEEWDTIGRVASFAESRNMPELARTAYEALTRSPQLGHTGYVKLLSFAREDRDAAAIRNISTELAAMRPESRGYAKLACYMNLLLGSRIEEFTDRARQLARNAPDDPEGKILVAFGCFRMGDIGGAKQECIDVNVDDLSPGYRAAAAAILGAVGEKVEAVRVSEGLPRSLLLEEEVLLISPWLPIF